jgi:regulator of protease activity HflC (stomatin/prohibitin superfamily)
MISIPSVVDFVGQNVRDLLPVVVIRSFERGVRSWLGREPLELQPGIWFRVPLVYTIRVVSTAEDSVNLPLQDVTTKDGHSVTFDANATYEVTDAVAHLCNVVDFTATLANSSMVHIARRVREMTWAELHTSQRDLERSLRETLTTRSKRWGVKINDVGLTSLVKAKTYRLVGN